MADESTGDKTEKASQQKLKKSRQEGQVVRSRDLSTAIGILVSLKLFVYLLPGYLMEFNEVFHQSFAPLDSGRHRQRHVDRVQQLDVVADQDAAAAVRGAAVHHAGRDGAGRLGGVDQALEPKLSRMSPMANIGRLFSGKHAFEVAISIGKAGVLIAVLIHVARSSVPTIPSCS
jgi:flagellar biosynthetic protein FlhB